MLFPAAFRPCSRCGLQKNLQLSVWKNDSTDIAALHDDSAACSRPLLMSNEQFSDLRNRGELRRSLRNFRCANSLRDVNAVEQDFVLHAFGNKLWRSRLLLDLCGGCEVFQFCVRRKRESVILQGFERQRTVHCAGIEIEIAQNLRDALRDAAFPGTGRAVNGDGEFTHEPEILFQKPMML